MKYPDDLIDRIICGDCRVLLAELPDACIDLTVTSPPYDNLRTYKGYTFDFETIARQLYRVTKRGGVVVWVVGDSVVDGSETTTSAEQKIFFRHIGFNIHDTMIWEKPGTANPDVSRYHQVFEYMFVLSVGHPKTFNGLHDRKNKWAHRFGKGTVRDTNGEMKHSKQDRIQYSEKGLRNNVWYMKTASQENICAPNVHPAPFSEKLAHDHILSWSNPGDVVLDPMIGSGTTGKMAKEAGRHWIGFDISQEYVDLAQQRVNGARVPFPEMTQ
jgi:DNA modification methylase